MLTQGMSPAGARGVNAIPAPRKGGLRAPTRRSSIPPFTHTMIVGVHPLAGFDKVLHYKVPEPMRSLAAVGSLVRVPVGNAMRLGVVGVVGPPADFPVDRLKSVAQVVYPFPALTPDL